jgi:hypothetical protein
LTIELHEKAREALDARATEFLSTIVEQPLQPEPPQRVWGERHIAGTITDADIIGPIRRTVTDGFGTPTSMDFYVGNRHFDIPSLAYEALLNLRDQILKVPSFKNTLSNRYVEDVIVSWCEKMLDDTQERQTFSDFLIGRAQGDIKTLSVLVPIANTRTEKEFDFGIHRIVSITSKLIDESERYTIERFSSDAGIIREQFNKWREEFLGLAAVLIRVRAEKRHAIEISIVNADIVVGLLRFFDVAAITPKVFSTMAILGNEYVPSTTAIIYDDVRIQHLSKKTSKHHLESNISAEHLREIQTALPALGALVDDANLSEFQERLRTCVLTYSKGATMPELSDRLVYSLSALEGLLLKDASEPIQQNIGERMAFMIAADTSTRQAIVSNIREVYHLRSQYVHHRRVPRVEQATIERFLVNAWATLRSALSNYARYRTKQDFIAAIDRLKFGG